MICLIVVFFIFVIYCLLNCEILSLQLHGTFSFHHVWGDVYCFVIILGVNDVKVATRLFNNNRQFKYILLYLINILVTKPTLYQQIYNLKIKMKDLWLSFIGCTIWKHKAMWEDECLVCTKLDFVKLGFLFCSEDCISFDWIGIINAG